MFVFLSEFSSSFSVCSSCSGHCSLCNTSPNPFTYKAACVFVCVCELYVLCLFTCVFSSMSQFFLSLHQCHVSVLPVWCCFSVPKCFSQLRSLSPNFSLVKVRPFIVLLSLPHVPSGNSLIFCGCRSLCLTVFSRVPLIDVRLFPWLQTLHRLPCSPLLCSGPAGS